MPRCAQCHAIGYCAVDCSYAPWNVYENDGVKRFSRTVVERATPFAVSPFIYILRFRRWLGHPPNRRDVRFAFDPKAQNLLGLNFWTRPSPDPTSSDHTGDEQATGDGERAER